MADQTLLASLQQKIFALWKNSTVTNSYYDSEKTYKHGTRCKERKTGGPQEKLEDTA